MVFSSALVDGLEYIVVSVSEPEELASEARASLGNLRYDLIFCSVHVGLRLTSRWGMGKGADFNSFIGVG